MNVRFQSAVVALLVLAGCLQSNNDTGSDGGASTGSATVTGTINGQSFSPSDAISAITPVTDPQGTVGAVGISTQAGLCARFTAGLASRNAQNLVLVMGDYNGITNVTVAPTTGGTYPIYVSGQRPAQFGGAVYSQTDANCNQVGSGVGATSGSVTITSVSGGSYSGSFDLTLETRDRITGTFTATDCSALASVLNQTTQLQCR